MKLEILDDLNEFQEGGVNTCIGIFLFPRVMSKAVLV